MPLTVVQNQKKLIEWEQAQLLFVVWYYMRNLSILYLSRISVIRIGNTLSPEEISLILYVIDRVKCHEHLRPVYIHACHSRSIIPERKRCLNLVQKASQSEFAAHFLFSGWTNIPPRTYPSSKMRCHGCAALLRPWATRDNCIKNIKVNYLLQTSRVPAWIPTTWNAFVGILHYPNRFLNAMYPHDQLLSRTKLPCWVIYIKGVRLCRL